MYVIHSIDFDIVFERSHTHGNNMEIVIIVSYHRIKLKFDCTNNHNSSSEGSYIQERQGNARQMIDCHGYRSFRSGACHLDPLLSLFWSCRVLSLFLLLHLISIGLLPKRLIQGPSSALEVLL